MMSDDVPTDSLVELRKLLVGNLRSPMGLGVLLYRLGRVGQPVLGDQAGLERFVLALADSIAALREQYGDIDEDAIVDLNQNLVTLAQLLYGILRGATRDEEDTLLKGLATKGWRQITDAIQAGAAAGDQDFPWSDDEPGAGSEVLSGFAAELTHEFAHLVQQPPAD